MTDALKARRPIFLPLFSKINSRRQTNEPTTSGNLTAVSGVPAQTTDE